ncbi:hypothetical protein Vau01_059420 [Virgisporangium aurantiacum]|uniref:Uncharacterized protein n=1 Tax=Virgisporangium aurantiacum TaxID=175570 RepID=A0A8J3Z6N6_9ACTN|nr:hypothetical protein Vau01_059420 [Virgisporangium aurantiacum]
MLAVTAVLMPVAPAAAGPVGAGADLPATLPVGDRMVPVTYSADPAATVTGGVPDKSAASGRAAASGGGVTAMSCLGGWRTLAHGELNHDVEATAYWPYWLKATGSGNGYQQFIFCRISNDVWTFYSNASKQYVTTYATDYAVRADGTDPTVYDTWHVCALDGTWVEISFFNHDRYMGNDGSSTQWIDAVDRTPGGRNLFRRSQFGGVSLPGC